MQNQIELNSTEAQLKSYAKIGKKMKWSLNLR